MLTSWRTRVAKVSEDLDVGGVPSHATLGGNVTLHIRLQEN